MLGNLTFLDDFFLVIIILEKYFTKMQVNALPENLSTLCILLAGAQTAVMVILKKKMSDALLTVLFSPDKIVA